MHIKFTLRKKRPCVDGELMLFMNFMIVLITDPLKGSSGLLEPHVPAATQHCDRAADDRDDGMTSIVNGPCTWWPSGLAELSDPYTFFLCIWIV